jgi:homoserine O-acetyltransferase
VNDSRFQSSDSVRSSAPLAHARVEHFEERLELERGGTLEGCEVAYETWGELDAERSNALLVCHAISGDSHAARHGPDDAPGWWDVVVGPGRPVDTERWFVICVNTLGSCRGSTGPASPDPATGRPYGADFPEITVGDMVECQRRLLDRLGIERLRSVLGGSLGGHQALAWAARYPERVASVMAIATSPRLTSQATAFDVVGRNAIRSSDPETGLAVARMLGHITYLSREAMAGRFDADRLASVTAYLEHQGARFVERFDPQSYLVLSLAMDRFDVVPGQLARAHCRWLVVSFSSDWLFPPEQSREIVRALASRGRPVAYCEVTSRCGHDAFLLPDDIEVYGELVRGFLAAPAAVGEGAELVPELAAVADLLEPGASVLDAGCGTGVLLASLAARGHRVAGIEADERAVVEAVGRGLDVIHAPVPDGLAAFGHAQFDVGVLSGQLERVSDVERTLQEALRVARRVVVTFDNAAWHGRRERLAKQGRAAEDWHAGPPRRSLSIADFESWAHARGLSLERLVGLDSESGREVPESPNQLADRAIAVITR